MSNNVDERIVRLKFDNSQFEQKTKTSISTLEKLNERIRSVQFNKVGDDLNALNKTANSVKMDGLKSNVETVSLKFSMLDAIAVTALTRIANAAVTTGKKVISALTLDSVIAGFKEYETQMGAIQTIMANTSSKGTTLEQVNSALNTLNTYADKTIYNFTEMTRNIGTFTAAGVGLQTSVESIQGIANLAAVSGSTSQQASTAMYQLSQAIAAGTVKLMDWNSVVNAGMGGEVFQNALIRTSEHLKTGAKDAIKANGSFRESLSTGWLTTKVLTETLKQFSLSVDTAEDYNNAIKSLVQQGYTEKQAKAIADMAKTAGDAATKVKTFSQLIDTLKEALGSGWTQTWQVLIGDFEEAKSLWTGVSDVLSNAINDMSTARNEFLKMSLTDSWKNVQTAVEGCGISFGKYKKAIKEVAKEQGIDGAAIRKSAGSWEKAFKSGMLPAHLMTDALMKFADSSDTAINVSYDAEKSIGQLQETITRKSGRQNIIDGLANSFHALISILTPIKNAFNAIIPKATTEQIWKLTDSFSSFTAKLKLSNQAALGVSTIVRALLLPVRALIDVAQVGAKIIGKLANVVVSGVQSLLEYISSFYNVTQSGFKVLQGVESALKNFWSTLKESEGVVTLVDAFERLKESFSGLVDGPLGKVKSLFDKLIGSVGNLGVSLGKADISGIVSVFSLMAGALGKLIDAFIDGSEAVAEFFKPITDFAAGKIETVFAAITDKLQSLSEVTHGASKSFTNLANNSKKLSANLKIKEASFNVFSIAKEKVEGLWLAIKSIGSGIGKVVSKIQNGFKGMIEGFGSAKDGVSNFATGLLNGLKNLGSAIGPVLSKIMSKIGEVLTNPQTWIIGSMFLQNLAKAFATMKLGQLGGSLSGMFESFGKLADEGLDKITAPLKAVKETLENFQKDIKPKTIMAIAVAIGIMAASIWTLSKIPAGQLLVATGSLVTASGMLLVAIKVLSDIQTSFTKMKKFKPDQFASLVTSMIPLATSMFIMGMALKQVAELSWGQMAVGLAGMAGCMVILEAGMASMAFMAKTKKFKFSAITNNITGMIGLAAAIGLMALALKVVGTMDPTQMLTGLAAISGLMLGLAVFAEAVEKNSTDFAKAAASTMAIAVAINLLVAPLAILGAMPVENLIQGGIAIMSLSVILAAASQLAEGSTDGAAALLALATSINLLTGPLLIFGALPWETLIQGGGAIVVLMTSMALAASIAKESSMEGAASILAMAAAMNMLVIPIVALGSLNIGTVVQGLGVMAVCIVGLIAAAGGAEAVAPGLTALGTSVALIGAGMAAAGIGIAAFTAALVVLGTLGSSAILALSGTLVALATALGGALLVFATFAGTAAATFIGSFVTGLLGQAVLIIAGIQTVATIALTAINSLIPQVVQLAMTLVLSFLTGLATNMYKFTTLGIQCIINFLNGVAAQLPSLIESAINVAIQFMNGFATAITEHGAEISNAMIRVIVSLASLMGIRLPAAAWNAVVKMAQKAVAGVPKFLSAGKQLIVGLINGVGEKISAAVNKVKEIITKVQNINWVSKLKNAGINFIQGLINGIGDMVSKAVQAAKDLAGKVVDSINKMLGNASPSKKMRWSGNMLILGLVKGINDTSKKAIGAAESVAGGCVDTMNASLQAVSSLAVGDVDLGLSPTITPVVDLSNVERSSATIDTLLGGMKTANVGAVNASFESARFAKADLQNQNGSGGNTITYTQNNYSPKALSRYEIYRQTKNQIRTLKGALAIR